MSIRYISDGSSILDSDANLLVVPVNCRAGVMGAGLSTGMSSRQRYSRDTPVYLLRL